MAQHREALFGVVRPWLAAPGWSAERIKAFDAALDAAGVPKDSDPSAAPIPPVPSPKLPGLGAPLDPDIAMVDVALLALVSDNTEEELVQWVGPIRAACVKFEINTMRRVAAFIAQMAHESGLKPRSENLNYSVEGLLRTFGRHRISEADARRYGRTATRPANQEAIANCIYGGAWGLENLGNTSEGDGWTFRGGGPGQMTGRDNWTRFAKAMGMSLSDALAYGRTIEGGIMAFAWFWEENDINRLADTPGVSDETRKINGGENGLADRTAKFNALITEMLRRERGAAK